ncbi:IS630 family transposase [Azohydromonas australica]|uniref:IS630 family transposase n=1 Tax=Azohydromonas australica TaxID=364039 RepID=UPI0004255BCC|nr:IS630 family transposase [Azohydromonas australica]
MKPHDARQESEEALQLMRRQAHRLRHEEKLSWTRIAELLGIGLTTMKRWVSRYCLDNPELGGVVSFKRGRQVGTHRTLGLENERELRDVILQERPEKIGIALAMWTQRAVQQAVKIKFGVDMPLRTVGEYLRRWGYTPQRPARRAKEQDPVAVDHWLQHTYPAIAKRAKAEGALIFWGDETAVRQDTAWVRGYAPQGQTPELTHATRWTSISMISAITNQGLVHFELHEGAINTERFISFMAALMRDNAGRKIFLIVDNLRVHHAKEVMRWIAHEDRKGLIELFHLPSYSPEHNPDEWLNRDLKTHLRSKPSAKNGSALRQMTTDFMSRLETIPSYLKSYFTHRYTSYAAT